MASDELSWFDVLIDHKHGDVVTRARGGGEASVIEKELEIIIFF